MMKISLAQALGQSGQAGLRRSFNQSKGATESRPLHAPWPSQVASGTQRLASTAPSNGHGSQDRCSACPGRGCGGLSSTPNSVLPVPPALPLELRPLQEIGVSEWTTYDDGPSFSPSSRCTLLCDVLDSYHPSIIWPDGSGLVTSSLLSRPDGSERYLTLKALLDQNVSPSQAQEMQVVDMCKVVELAIEYNQVWNLASVSKEGCLVVQDAIKAWAENTVSMSRRDLQKDVAKTFQGLVSEAFQSPHANHVLCACLKNLPAEMMGFVTKELLAVDKDGKPWVEAAAIHKYGCRVLERLLEHSSMLNEDMLQLLSIVLHGETCGKLVKNQYGNFVVQHILEHGTDAHRSHVATVLKKDLLNLARHRIASHVVEKALLMCSLDDRHAICEEIRKNQQQLIGARYSSFVVRVALGLDRKRGPTAPLPLQ